MKKIVFLFALLCGMTAFIACSDDDNNNETPTPVCPVTNVALQQTGTVEAGDEVTLTGEGFTTETKLALEKNDQRLAVLLLKVAADGKQVTFTVPEAEDGTYKLILIQDGEWPLTLELKILNSIVRMTGYTYNSGIEGSTPNQFTFHYNDQGQLVTIQKNDPDNNNEMVDYMLFTYPSKDDIKVQANMDLIDPMSGSGMQDYFTLVLKNNRVNKTITKDFSGTVESKEWSYNEKGYPEVVHLSPYLSNAYTFDETGNLTAWDFMNMHRQVYEYEYQSTDYPNVMGWEFGVIYQIITNETSMNTALPELYAQFLGLAGKASGYLPSGMKGFKDGEQIVIPFTYSKNKKGYLTEASVPATISKWNGSETVKLEVTRKFTFTWENFKVNR